jgi:hypothetical protein
MAGGGQRRGDQDRAQRELAERVAQFDPAQILKRAVQQDSGAGQQQQADQRAGDAPLPVIAPPDSGTGAGRAGWSVNRTPAPDAGGRVPIAWKSPVVTRIRGILFRPAVAAIPCTGSRFGGNRISRRTEQARVL